MNFISYLFKLIKNNSKFYWYDFENECVYIPGDNTILELTIEDIRRIIFDRKFKNWNTQEIFSNEKLSANVNFWTLNYWVIEYEKGLMDPMISYLANINKDLSETLLFLDD